MGQKAGCKLIANQESLATLAKADLRPANACETWSQIDPQYPLCRQDLSQSRGNMAFRDVSFVLSLSGAPARARVRHVKVAWAAGGAKGEGVLCVATKDAGRDVGDKRPGRSVK